MISAANLEVKWDHNSTELSLQGRSILATLLGRLFRNASGCSFREDLANYHKLVKSLQMFPFPRNEDVVIRKEIISELERKLPVSSRHQSAALWGLGGSGYATIFNNLSSTNFEEKHKSRLNSPTDDTRRPYARYFGCTPTATQVSCRTTRRLPKWLRCQIHLRTMT